MKALGKVCLLGIGAIISTQMFGGTITIANTGGVNNLMAVASRPDSGGGVFEIELKKS